MSRASEKCGCGASIEVTSDYDSRLQTSLSEWREGHQHTAPKDEPEAEPTPEHHPQGNNFSVTERKGVQLEPYELHGQYRPDSYGSISLKWRPRED